MTTIDTSAGGAGPIFDVHLHALPAAPIHFAVSDEATGDPALLRRVYAEPVAGEEQLAETLLSGNETLVRRWTAVRPDRFLPAFTPDVEREYGAATVARRWEALFDEALAEARSTSTTRRLP